MLLAILRCYSPNWNPDDFIQRMGFETDAVWHKGEIGPRGKPRDDSGFSLAITDALSLKELKDDVRTFVQEYSDDLTRLSSAGVTLDLDIGVTVGDSEQFAVSIYISPDDMALFSKVGVGVTFSAYPTSDEANEDQTDNV